MYVRKYGIFAAQRILRSEVPHTSIDPQPKLAVGLGLAPYRMHQGHKAGTRNYKFHYEARRCCFKSSLASIMDRTSLSSCVCMEPRIAGP